MSINYNDYKLRITNATPLRLTLITFELIIENIDEAIGERNIKNQRKNLEMSKKFLRELINSLDMSFKISANLFDIYVYVNKLLIRFEFDNNVENLKESKELLRELLDGFSQIKENDETKVMDNIDEIYAGLTYKNGKLVEYVESKNNKGFKV